MKKVILIVLLAVVWVPFTAFGMLGDDSSREGNICLLSVDFFIGGLWEGSYLNAENMVQKLPDGKFVYNVYSFDSCLKKNLVAGRPTLCGNDGPSWYQVLFSEQPGKPQAANKEYSWIAVSSPWPAMPRTPKLQKQATTEQEQAIKAVLKKAGLKDVQPQIEKIVRVDLDGDGCEEAIITASNMKGYELSPYGKKGDYSLVLLRKVVQGQIQNIVLASDIHLKDPSTKAYSPAYKFWTPFFLDIDGDGVLEIILQAAYHEGEWIEVLKIENKKVKKVLSEGVGL